MSARRLLMPGFLAVVLLGPASSSFDQTTEGAAPSARRHSAIAYDAVGQRVLLFGGVRDGSNVQLDDLWSWNGATWTQVSASTGASEIGTVIYGTATDVFSVTPGGRVSRLDATQWVPVSGATTPLRGLAAFSYDTARGRLVRFGGSDAPGRFTAETWEFDGQAWSAVTSEGPSARLLPAMAYDPERRVTTLFGGLSLSEQRLADTWEWDGRAWRDVTSAGPDGRFGAAMVFDGGAEALLLFGGTGAGGFRNDLWRWSSGAWVPVMASGGPSPRTEALMAFDAARWNVVLYGGEAAPGYEADTWTWDGRTWAVR